MFLQYLIILKNIQYLLNMQDLTFDNIYHEHYTIGHTSLTHF